MVKEEEAEREERRGWEQPQEQVMTNSVRDEETKKLTLIGRVA